MRFIKKITVVLMLCTLLIIPQTGCSNEEPVSENQFLLDTVCTLTVYGMGEADAQAAIDKAFECCRDYENMLSKTVEGSDIYRSPRLHLMDLNTSQKQEIAGAVDDYVRVL